MSRPRPVPPPSPEAADLLARWLAQLTAVQGRSPLTAEAYARAVTGFLGFLQGHLGGDVGRAALAGLRVADFRAWMAAEHARGLSPRSLARSASAVRGFFDWLAASEGIDCQGVLALKSPRVRPGLPRPLAEEDARALIATVEALQPIPWIAARDGALLTLIWGAGLRISEALGLTWGAAPLAATVRVRGKGDKWREVPVLPVSRTLVERYRRLCPHAPAPGDALFRGARGGPLRAQLAEKAVREARAALGLPATATPHALRHAFATQMLAAGGDLRSVQELLGHASLSSTQVYADLDPRALARVYDAAHPRARRDRSPKDGGAGGR